MKHIRLKSGVIVLSFWWDEDYEVLNKQHRQRLALNKRKAQRRARTGRR